MGEQSVAHVLNKKITFISKGNIMKNFTLIQNPLHAVGTAIFPTNYGVVASVLSPENPHSYNTAYKKTDKILFKPAKSSMQTTACQTKRTKQVEQKVNQAQQLLLMQAMWLSQSKDSILQDLFCRERETVAFSHWLTVPSLGVILSFSHQRCVKVAWL